MQKDIRHIRRELPAVEEKVYLNTGTCGPLPKATTQTIKRTAEEEWHRGRSDLEHFEKVTKLKTDLRNTLASALNARPEEIALTHSTSESMNIVLWGLNWQPGDEVVVTNMEHEGGLAPLYMLRHRRGINLKFWDVNGDRDTVLKRLERLLTPRTRLVLCSHVLWSSGAVLPLKEIAALAHDNHAYVLVDGAQSFGAIPVDVKETAVDFYAFPGQKWLCGPDGTGGLYLAEERLTDVQNTYTGWASVKDMHAFDMTGYFVPAPGAARYEVGGINRPTLSGWLESLRWLQNEVEWNWVYERIQTNRKQFRSALATIKDLQIITPENEQSGLINFHMEGVNAKYAVSRLYKENINIRFIPTNMSLRVSTGFYNDQTDLERLIDALSALKSE